MNFIKDHIATLNQEKMDIQEKIMNTEGLTAKSLIELITKWGTTHSALDYMLAMDAKFNTQIISPPPGMKIMN